MFKFYGQGEKRSSGSSPLEHSRGPEGAGKSGTEGLSVRTTDRVRTGGPGFPASASECMQYYYERM